MKIKNFIKINLIMILVIVLSSISAYGKNLIGNSTDATMRDDYFTSTSKQGFSRGSSNTNVVMSNITNSTDIDYLNQERESLEKEISTKESIITYNEEEMSVMLVEIEELSQQIADKENEVEELLIKAKDINKYVETTQEKLDAAQEEYDAQKEILDDRLVAMYKMGKVEYIDVLLNSDSLSAFLSNYYLISKIVKADSDLLEEVKEKRDSIQALEETLKTYQSELDYNIDEATKTKVALTNMKVLKDNKVATLNKQDLDYHNQIEEYRNQIAALEARIKLLVAANASGTPYVGGDFVWPVPGYNKITSKFGMRTHPITGVYKLHTGTDIGAPTGADFVASNKGIVIAAEYNTAYGNYVMIDHGGGIQTLYAHGSQIVVSVGQEVSAGEVVLKVGSTGYATGPHAHFEVRINGTPVEPLTYLQATGYVYD